MVTRKRLYSERCHFWHLQAYRTNITNATQFWEGSVVCAKLEPAGSKNNEITEINVLQKFTPHALCRACFDFVSIVLKYLSFPIPVSNRTSKLGSDSFHSHLSFTAAYSLKSEKVWPADFATL